MNFERGKDPKKSMEVGAEKVAVKVYSVEYDINDSTTDLPEYAIAEFLSRLEKLSIGNDSLKDPQIIKIEYNENVDQYEEWTTPLLIHEWAGEILEWEGKYFQMPSLDEIQRRGFEHLISMSYRYVFYELDTEEKEKFDKAINGMKFPIPLLETPSEEVEDENDEPLMDELYDPGWKTPSGGGYKVYEKNEDFPF